MHSWLLSFSEIFSSKTLNHSSELEETQSYHPICALPGWAYARALAFRAEGDDHASQVRPSVPVDKHYQLIE